MKLAKFFSLASGLLATLSLSAQAETINWTNTSGGAWSTAENWDLNRPPGPLDTVLITAGGTYTVTLDVSTTVTALTLGGASGQAALVNEGHTLRLRGAGRVTTNGVLTLNSGALAATGALIIEGQAHWNGATLSPFFAVTVAPGGVVNFNSGIIAGALTNRGTVRWETGDLQVQNDGAAYVGAIWNQPGALWDIRGDGTLSAWTGAEVFHNAGVLRKSAGSGASSLSLFVDQSGPVEGQSGTLQLANGGSLRGAWVAETGAALHLGAGIFTAGTGCSWSGAGACRLTGGTLVLEGEVVPTLEIAGGALVLAPSFQGGTIRTLALSGSYTLSATGAVSGSLVLNGVTLDGALRVQSGGLFSAKNAALNAAVEVAGGGVFDWTGGSLNPGAALTIKPRGLLNLNSASLYAALTNQGTVRWQGGGLQVLNGPGYFGAIWNTAGAVWDIQCDQTLSGWSGVEEFHNAGLVVKSEGFGAAALSVFLDNTGIVQARSGTLQLNAGGALGGRLLAGAGTAIHLAGGAFAAGTAGNWEGPGAIRLAGGSLTLAGGGVERLQLAGGTVWVAPSFQGGSITNLVLSGATLGGTNRVRGVLTLHNSTLSGSLSVLDGGVCHATNATLSGTLAVEDYGVLDWNGGSLSGGSSLTVWPEGLLSLRGGIYLDSPLTNYGTVQWIGDPLYVRNNGDAYTGAVWNEAAGLWDIRGDAAMYCNWCSIAEQFHNAGLLLKRAGAGTASLNVFLDNTGTVASQSGTIQFNNGVRHEGTFLAGAGAAVNMSGDCWVAPWSYFEGPGEIRFAGGNLTLVDDQNPNLLITGGTVTLDPMFQGGMIARLTLLGGTLVGTNTVSGELILNNAGINGALSILSGGSVRATNLTITGAMVVEGPGVFNWSGGYLAPSSTLSVASNGVLTLDSVTLAGALANQGTVRWLGGWINLRNNGGDYTGAIWNEAGGLFDIQCDQALSYDWWSGGARFRNDGLLLKSAGSGTSSVNILFDNTGTVHAQTGILQFNGGGTLAGSLAADAGAAINLAGNYTGSWPDTRGEGTIQFNGASLTLDPSFQGGTITNLTLSGTTLLGSNVVSGTLTLVNGTVSGTLVILPGAVVNATNETFSGVLAVQGGVLNAAGATLDGSAQLDTGSVFNWAGGYLTPSSTLSVASGAVLNLLGYTTLAGLLSNQGTVRWLDGYVPLRNNGGDYTGAIWNQAGGLFDIQCDQSMNYEWWSGTAFFRNDGLLLKSAGTNPSILNILFNNTGIVHAQTGAFQFNGGGLLAGSFAADAGAVISAAGSYTAAWSDLSGEGTIQFFGATLALDPAFQGGSITNLTLVGATVTGSNSVSGSLTLVDATLGGPLAVQNGAVLRATNLAIQGALAVQEGGFFNWSGGSLAPGSTLTVAAGSDLNLGGGIALAGVLASQGTVAWLGGWISLRNNGGDYTGAIRNEAGGLFDIQCDDTIQYDWWSGYGRFYNAGLLLKSTGPATTSVNVFLENYGVVEGQTGALAFNGGGRVAGTFTAGADAFINAAGPYTAGPWPLFGGDGLVQFVGASVGLDPAFEGEAITNLTLVSSTLSGSNAVRGALTLAGSGGVSGTLAVLDGGVVYSTNQTFSALVRVEGGGVLHSTSGYWPPGAGLTILPSGVMSVENLTLAAGLTNQGTVHWSAGWVNLMHNSADYAGAIWNQAGGLVDIQCDQSVNYASWSGTAQFHNAGRVLKSAGAGATTIAVYFDNQSGSVEAQTGTIQFSAGSDLAGTWKAHPAGAVSFNGGANRLNGAADFRGPGPVAVTGGSLALNLASGTVNFYGGSLTGDSTVGGTLNWQGGQVDPGASLTVLSNGVLNLAGAAKHLLGPLTNQGTVTWQSGDLNVYFGAPWGYLGEIWNEAGAAWDVQCDQSLTQPCCYLPAFHNAGLLRKSAGAGTTHINLAFDNTGGVVEAQTGTFQFNAGAGLDGAYQALAGAAVHFYGGVFVLNGPADFRGPGVVAVTGGSLALNQTSGTVNFFGGSLVGDSTVGGTLNWQGGQIDPSASLTVLSNAVLNLAGGVKYISGTLTNQGTVNWQDGILYVRFGSPWGYLGEIWNEAGAAWEIQCDQTMVQPCCYLPAFHNAGLVRKTAGAGTTSFNVSFDNTGAVEVLAGTIQFNSGGRASGSFVAGAGAAVYLMGSYGVGPWPAFGGAGTVQFSGGTLTFDPAFAGASITNITLSGMTLAGDNAVSGSLTLINCSVSGSLTVLDGGVLNCLYSALQAGASVTVASNAVLNVGDVLFLGGPLTNHGTVNWLAGTVLVYNDGGAYSGGIWNEARGLWNLQCEQSIVTGGYSPWWGWGASPAGYAQFHNNGQVRKDTGLGASVFNVVFDNHGLLDVQSGMVSLDGGGFTQPLSMLRFGITGPASYGRAVFASGVSLAGVVSVTLNGGYSPAPGDSFAVLGYGAAGGMFDRLELPPEAAWEPRSDPTLFWLSVSNALRLAPIADRIVRESTLLSLTATATDTTVPASALTFGLDWAPSGMTIDPLSGAIAWTPALSQCPSANTVVVSVTNHSTPPLRATALFVVTVVPNLPNLAPVLPVVSDQAVREFSLLTVTNTAAPTGLETLVTYELIEPPAGAAIDDSGVITWMPVEDQGPALHVITTVAARHDPNDPLHPLLSTTNSFTVAVSEGNAAPVLPVLHTRTVNELALLSVANTAAEPDVDATLDYQLIDAPAGAQIDASGLITWTPTQLQSHSTYTITTVVTSTDLADPVHPRLSATNQLVVVVREVNQTPVLPVVATQFLIETRPLTVTNTALFSDMHGTLAYRLAAAPAGALIDASGVITWTPGRTPSPVTILFTTVATSSNLRDLFTPFASATNSFAVVVRPHLVVMDPIPDRSANPGQTVLVTNASSGAEGGWVLTYTLVAGPAGATVDPATGLFSWRAPITAALSTNTVQIRVSDNASPPLTDTKQFAVRVNPLAPVQLAPVSSENGVFTLSVSGSPGPDYTLQGSANLVTWTNLITRTPETLPLTLSDTNPAPARFYRVLLGP